MGGVRDSGLSRCGKAEDGSGKRGGMRLASFRLELLGPLPSPVKYADYPDNIILDSIWNDVGRSGHNQFTGADHSAGPAHRGMPREPSSC